MYIYIYIYMYMYIYIYRSVIVDIEIHPELSSCPDPLSVAKNLEIQASDPSSRLRNGSITCHAIGIALPKLNPGTVLGPGGGGAGRGRGAGGGSGTLLGVSSSTARAVGASDVVGLFWLCRSLLAM